MKFHIKMNECEGGCGDGGAPAGGGEIGGGDASPVTPPGGCDHSHNGYFGPGCFHVPMPVWGVAYGGSRRKKKKGRKSTKHSYEKGIKIIKSYDDLVSEAEDYEQWTFVLNVPSQHIEKMLRSSYNENEMFNIQQFLKYLDKNRQLLNDQYEIVGIFGQKSKQCFALAVLMYDRLNINDCYIAELMTLRRGFGKILMDQIISHTENAWLMSDPDSGEVLCDKFYRKNSKLTEIKIDGGHIYDDGMNSNHRVLHLFYANNCSHGIPQIIVQQFMKKDN